MANPFTVFTEAYAIPFHVLIAEPPLETGLTAIVAAAHHLFEPPAVNAPGFSEDAFNCRYDEANDTAEPPDEAPLF